MRFIDGFVGEFCYHGNIILKIKAFVGFHLVGFEDYR